MKTEYKILEFSITSIQEMLESLNEKGKEGYKIINTYYYKSTYGEHVRYILELEY